MSIHLSSLIGRLSGTWRAVASAPRLGVDRAVALAEREGGPGAAARASSPSGRTRADMHPPVTTANLGVECALFLRRASCAGLVPAARSGRPAGADVKLRADGSGSCRRRVPSCWSRCSSPDAGVSDPLCARRCPSVVPLSVPLTQRSASGLGHLGSVATGPERHDGGGSLPTRWARPAAKPLGRTLTQFDARFE